MGLDDVRDVDIGDHVDVVHQKRRVERGEVRDASPRLEDLRLAHDVHAWPFGALMQMTLDEVGQVVKVHAHVFDARFSQTVEHPIEGGSVCHRHQWLGHAVGEGSQSGAQARAENDGLHGYSRNGRRSSSNARSTSPQDSTRSRASAPPSMANRGASLPKRMSMGSFTVSYS